MLLNCNFWFTSSYFVCVFKFPIVRVALPFVFSQRFCYPAERSKISLFYAYYLNKNVPELNQDEAPEFRSAIQLTYNLLKAERMKVNLRLRLEDRHLHNEDSYFEAVQRLRFQIKTVCPINDIKIKENVLYAFASDEVFFKTKSQVSGPEIFDRNRFTIGLGYAFTSDMQIELSYVNEIMPRKKTDKLVNAIQATVIFNNLLPNLLKSFNRTKKDVDDSSGN